MKIQHKKSLVGILFVILIIFGILSNDTIGQYPTDIFVNLIIAVITGSLGLFWGLIFSLITSIVYMLDGSELPIAGFVAILCGNIIYVLALHISPGVIEHSIKPFLFLTPMLGASLLKYYLQFFTATKIAPLVFNATDSQLADMSKRFGANQLISALIGSIAGIMIVKLFKLLTRKNNEIQPL